MVTKNVTKMSGDDAINKLAEGFRLKTKGQSLWEGAYSLVSKHVASTYAPNMEQLGRNLGSSTGLSSKNSQKLGSYTKDLWLTAIPMGFTFYKTSKNIRETVGSYLGLSNEYNRSLRAAGTRNFGMFTSMNTDLEIVRNERELLGSKARNDTKTMLSSLLLDLPNTLAARLDTVVKDLNPYNRQRRGNTSKLDKAADNVDQRIDSFLDKISVNGGQGDDREYNGLLNGVIKSFNNGAGLESLHDPKNRYEVLKDISEKALGPLVTTGASALKPTLTKVFNIRSDAAFKKPSAGKMIKALETHMKKNPTPVSLSLAGCSKKECSLEDYIVDIFKQHQKDSGRAAIPSNMQGRLKQAAEQIAEAMRDPQRQMHPQALAILVDKKRGIASFSGKDLTEVKYGAELDGYLAELQKKPSMSSRKKVSAAQQYKRMEATREQFAESWGNLNQDEKFLWSTFLSNEILSDLGVEKQELFELRNQQNDLWDETMEEIFSSMSKMSPEDLQNIGLNDSQIEALSEAVSGMKRKNNHYLQKNRQELTDLVADAATLMDGDKPDFLKEALGRVQNRRRHEEILEEKRHKKPLSEQVQKSRSETSETRR